MQREALFNKSERQVAESQLATVQQQLAELQATSSHIQELHKDIQESQGLVKQKDRKVRASRTLLEPRSQTHVLVFAQITELSKEVFRLKEALGALSPPLGITTSSSTSSTSAPPNNPGQQVALQNRISILSQQLQVRKGSVMSEGSLFELLNISCDVVAGLGEEAQAGCDHLSLPPAGGCAGEAHGQETHLYTRHVCHSLKLLDEMIVARCYWLRAHFLPDCPSLR